MEKLKDHGDLVFAGDGRHDSMGHAKYCAYTIFCCTVPLIIHFTLVQVGFSHSTVLYHILIYTVVPENIYGENTPTVCLEKVVFKWHFPLFKPLRRVKVSMQLIFQCNLRTG